jgi:hypothetical protein
MGTEAKPGDARSGWHFGLLDFPHAPGPTPPKWRDGFVLGLSPSIGISPT